jgi:purine-nucleoside phosphorylase
MEFKIMYEKLGVATKGIQSISNRNPKIGIILGSGLGSFIESIEDKTIIPYSEIPYFKETTVEGHEGRLILGSIEGIEIAILQGRLHAYEGLPMEEVVFPVRTLATLGVESLILTNAAGGINPHFSPGDLILIKDHINFMGKNPLIGDNINELGPRFPDMTKAYNPKYRKFVEEAAEEMNIKIKSGVYAGVLGPTYETPAEVKMLEILGADMVGMSTVPESIAANHLGLKVVGISCITNMAAGIENIKLEHDDVKNQALKVMEYFTSLLRRTLIKINNQEE